ncbi:probable N-acetyltransferase CML1 [Erpetoichthys calabaricus]|uniref:probable N-acetyltransferase CML1 n=1 Tax=Erpetoichthys calabaricus TaxID=27687 RepID=UPI00109FDF4D|nr:probable N-acetyltransferase CML1 [Erpetoichthys calabaricus]
MPVEDECDASDFQIRVFEPKDYPAVKRLFIDGIMENVTPAFKEALLHPVNLAVLAGIAALTYALPGHLRWLGFVVATAWIAAVYWCCHMFYAIYVNDKLASEMKDIEKHFLSLPGNCYWVAEHKKLKVIGGMVAVKSCAGASKKEVITRDRKSKLSKSTPANIISAQEEMGDEGPRQNNAQSDTSHHKAECQDTAESCEMFRMIVDRQYRRHGLGVRLTQTVLDFAQEHEYKTCILGTSKAQKAAQKLYLKVGFQLIKTYTPDIKRFISVLTGAKELYFEKQL